LAKTNDHRFISYYLSKYGDLAEGDIIHGGYGPRLFRWNEYNQVQTISDLLRRKRDSRQAVIQLFDASDIVAEHKDIPCTCTLQFMIRGDALHMITHMRSNDVYVGLPHDVFAFTMLQEIIARDLSVDLGTYKHFVGSLHLYDVCRGHAQRFLDEGWQSTEMAMPEMPLGNPWPAVDSLLEAELALRTSKPYDVVQLERLDPYWADLIRLLQVYRYWKNKESGNIKVVRDALSSPTYRTFIDMKLNGA
jgi:thymidylate synthase